MRHRDESCLRNFRYCIAPWTGAVHASKPFQNEQSTATSLPGSNFAVNKEADSRYARAMLGSGSRRDRRSLRRDQEVFRLVEQVAPASRRS